MANAKDKTEKKQHIEAFTFGEPTPVLSQREIFDYLEAMNNGKYYEYPISLTQYLKKLFYPPP